MRKKLIHIFFCIMFCCSNGFSEKYSLFRKDGLYGIISNEKKIIFQPDYDYISINSNSILCSKNSKKEIYDSSLNLLYSSVVWVNLKFLTEDDILITESLSKQQYLLNVKTRTLSDYFRNEKYLVEEGYRENVGLVVETGKEKFLYSIVDANGTVLLTDIEEAHSVFSNGMLAVILKDGKSGFVNKQGQFVIETDFYIDPDDIGPRKYPIIRYFFNENYALVKTNNKSWVQFNIKGKMENLPEDLEPADYCYKNGLVPVLNKQTKKYGYMNPKFKIIIPCIFDEAREFNGRYAIVKYNNKEAITDKDGKIYFSEELN